MCEDTKDQTHICLLFSPLNWKDIVRGAFIMEKQMFG